jgi:hypothetical protein
MLKCIAYSLGAKNVGNRNVFFPLNELYLALYSKLARNVYMLVRGTARLQSMNGIVPEYAFAAERYFGEEGGKAWVAQLTSMIQEMVRIAITPEWVGLLDFQTRFPSALPL